MSFIYSNPNPKGKKVGDCVVRAISICMDKDWEEAYSDVCFQGLIDAGMPSEFDLKYYTIWKRIYVHHWSFEDAISSPKYTRSKDLMSKTQN